MATAVSVSHSHSRFRYREQLQPGEIRLLSRCPGSVDSNDHGSYASLYHLRAVSLDTAPEYVALSYTWGAPLETTASHAAYDGQTRELRLVVDDDDDDDEQRQEVEVMGIQLNLFEALEALEATPLPTRHAYWIDAVCINQDDYDERAAQVTRMARIYSSAHLVAVWLGRGFERKAEALELWEKLGPRIYRYSKTLQRYSVRDRADAMDTVWDSRLFKRRFDGYDLTPFLDTFRLFITQHRWFYRTWVVQEVVVASVDKLKPPIVLWEEHQLSWKEMATTCSFLSRIYRSALDETFGDAVRRSAAVFVRRQRLCGYYRETIRSLTDGADINWASIHMFKPNSENSLIATFYANLLRTVRHLHASEPRDRVYFGYGLVEELYRKRKDGGARLTLPRVDYRLPVTTVYRQTMTYLVQETPSLLVLGYCSPSGVETVSSSCPSWVPRFDLDHLFHTGPRMSRAGIPVEVGSFPRQVDGDVLTLKGKRLGRLHQTCNICFAVPDSPFQTSDLNLIEALLSFMVACMQTQAKKGLEWIESIAISMICGSVTNFDIESEVYPWRAGLYPYDTYDVKPRTWYVKRLMAFATVTFARVLSGDTASEPGEDGVQVGRCQDMVREIQRRCRHDPGSEDIKWPTEAEVRWYMECVKMSQAPEPVALRGGFDTNITEDAQDWHNSACAIDRLFRGDVEDPTALFATETGFVGKCRMHACPGDELWLIGDCPFPLILRPVKLTGELDSTQHPSYKLVSPAWARGVMEGELMTEQTISRMESVRVV